MIAMPRYTQDIIFAAMLAALVWLYAEGKDVQTYPEDSPTSLNVKFELADSSQYVVTPSNANVKVQFRGASAQVTRLRSDLLTGGIALTVDSVNSDGTTRIRMANAISSLLNIEVISVEPEFLELKVDRLVTQKLGLAFNSGDVELLGMPKISPEFVEIRLPERLLEAQGGNLDQLKGAVVYSELNKLDAGVEHTLQGKVSLPAVLSGDSHVTFSPKQVSVKLTIDKNEDTYVVRTVPVWLVSPPSEINGYIVKLDEQSRVLKNVEITGPSDVIARYKDGREKLRATFLLSSDDLARPATSAILQFNVLPKVKVKSDKTTINFTISSRLP